MKKTLTALSFITLASTPSTADDFNVSEVLGGAVDLLQQGVDLLWPDELGLDNVNAKIGFGVGFTPDYIGSDNYALRAVPLLDIRYKDSWRLSGSKLTFSPIRTKHFEAGPLLNLRFGRAEESNAFLEGLGDINTTFEVGGYVRAKYKSGFLTAEYRHGLGSGIKSNIQVTAGHGIYKSENFVALLSARVRWQDDQTAMTQFGITEQQAQNSVKGFDTYQASSGIYDVTTNLIGSYTVNKSTRLVGLVSYGKIVGSASDSPLVADAGSSNQFIVGTGLVFSF
ncbi:MipA/OmpV family protein [Kordiimonas sp. SCSIO 12603]|uniref:MipA/OmpV family protein n=1 Tax=Kordiimonas sp. SCSIO 12603 TaxID=2829596 RepID=UPI0021078C43|nr:MipA/OmpV family protein [Kordiimonas sp. SCSIO 12603]UTW59361.1 MipA/OmpV family protein [Kordiimonas sp. SCSIO 12603]